MLYGPNGMIDSTLSRLFFFSLFTIVFVLTLNYAWQVYYLDCVDYPKFRKKDLLPPRINKYTKKELMEISIKCKAKSSDDYVELPVSNN